MYLSIHNISKQYGRHQVLDNASLEVDLGTTISILGKSGCGKSTLLKIIAGLEPATSGQVMLQGKDISTQKPNERNIVYLFQEPLLFPHLTVFENIAFGLRIRKEAASDVLSRVHLLAGFLGLEKELNKAPHQLSGGQRQRVAFGRALIINPPLLLLDEPFSNLDAETRTSMQHLYKKVAREFNITTLFVTHDLKECLVMGDQIAYMEFGRLKVYPNREAFINDDKTGVRGELNFWNNL
jgi:ABC-type sugar transport system ATPase subunit